MNRIATFTPAVEGPRLRPEPPSSIKERPLLVARWEEVCFIHFEVDADALQRDLPLPLDLWQGRAFVSLVAFAMRGLRPARGGRWTAGLLRPFADQRFLNLRAYVRAGGIAGIYFIAEWNTHRPSVWLAPRTYGLPYRFGRIQYTHAPGLRRGAGEVRVGPERMRFQYACDAVPEGGCATGSLDAFLLERYVAFAGARDRLRSFRVWHAPWMQRRVSGLEVDDALLRSEFGWWKSAILRGAQVSPGFNAVGMGRPRRRRLRREFGPSPGKNLADCAFPPLQKPVHPADWTNTITIQSHQRT